LRLRLEAGMVHHQQFGRSRIEPHVPFGIWLSEQGVGPAKGWHYSLEEMTGLKWIHISLDSDSFRSERPLGDKRT
jgi:acyl-CoA reductase-like NAD-dependent aldehyde dehydrogenase